MLLAEDADRTQTYLFSKTDARSVSGLRAGYDCITGERRMRFGPAKQLALSFRPSPDHAEHSKLGIHETAANVSHDPMNEIRTRVVIGPDYRISGTAPAEVPAGEHEVTITLSTPSVQEQATKPFDPTELPRHDLGQWPNGLSLRREHIYGDDGR